VQERKFQNSLKPGTNFPVYWEATLPNLINDDETLVNLIITKHPAKGEREDKREDPSPSQKRTIPKGGAWGRSHC